jgi:DNA-binding NarL/FixJ family response regulator
MNTTTVAIVEDHPDLRNSLMLVLDGAPQFHCVGAYRSCEALLKDIGNGKIEPQVILMDIGLPGMSGIEGVRRVKEIHPDCDILMLTIYEDDANVFRAICSGASGYLLKKSTPAEIVEAVVQVAAGGVPMTPVIARKVMTMFRDFAPAPINVEAHLTPREKEVLSALVDGLDYKQIADRLFISFDTVRNHLRHIYEKLQVHSKSEAVARALKRRLI